MSPEFNQFPSIQGNNLNKEKKVVPDDFVDKNLIVIVAFQQWHLFYLTPSLPQVTTSLEKGHQLVLEVS